MGIGLADDHIGALSRAIGHWIEYKRYTNFDGIFGEQMLLVPIAEYFVGNGWQVKAEQDLNQLPGNPGRPGYVNYDLFAQRQGDTECQIIIEVKFLTKRSSNHARLHTDFVKLAIPRVIVINDLPCSRLIVAFRRRAGYPGSKSRLSLNIPT